MHLTVEVLLSLHQERIAWNDVRMMVVICFLGDMSLLRGTKALIAHVCMSPVGIVCRVFPTWEHLTGRESLHVLLEVLALHDHPRWIILLLLVYCRWSFVLHWFSLAVGSHHHRLILVLAHSQVVSVIRLILVVLGIIYPCSESPIDNKDKIINYSESWPMLVLSTELFAISTIPLEVWPWWFWLLSNLLALCNGSKYSFSSSFLSNLYGRFSSIRPRIALRSFLLVLIINSTGYSLSIKF